MSARFDVRIGFIPLTDFTPIAVAQARGFFTEQGVNVSLYREPSWANIRDKVAYGLLDAAHMLAPMPLADALGLGVGDRRLIAPFSLGLNGNAVTVSTALYDEMHAADPAATEGGAASATALAKVLAARRKTGGPKPVFAVVFPYSAQNYQLRYWFASAGVNPDSDVRLVVVPPPRMAAMLEAGAIDGYCVGAPWHAAASEGGFGRLLLVDWQFWGLKPEKVFAASEIWAEREPEALQAVLRALVQGAVWADDPANYDSLAEILASPAFVGASASALRWSLGGGDGRYQIFHRHAANYPWRSHAMWFLSQMARWGQAPADAVLKPIAERVYRPDLYAKAAGDLGIAAPAESWKVEGGHAEPWLMETSGAPIEMAPDRFFDGVAFDPDKALDYARNAPFSKL